MSFYLLSDEIIFYLASFLDHRSQIIASRVSKQLYYAINLNIGDVQKTTNWSCTFWFKEAEKTPVIAVVYPEGNYHQAKEHLNIVPTITTPGHIVYHAKKKSLIEHTQKLGSCPKLFRARQRRCFLKMLKRRGAITIDDVDLDRVKYDNKGRTITSFVQDAIIIYPNV